MSFAKPTVSAGAVNHVSAVELNRPYAGMSDRDLARLCRSALVSCAVVKRDSTIRRAEWAYVQKVRLACKIPYHEWAEALVCARFNGSGLYPSWRYGAIEELIEAYATRHDPKSPYGQDGPNCPPWAGRRYREECARVRAETFRTSDGGSAPEMAAHGLLAPLKSSHGHKFVLGNAHDR